MSDTFKRAKELNDEMISRLNEISPPGSPDRLKNALVFVFIKIAELEKRIDSLPRVADCAGQNCHACANPCEKYIEELR